MLWKVPKARLVLLPEPVGWSCSSAEGTRGGVGVPETH